MRYEILHAEAYEIQHTETLFMYSIMHFETAKFNTTDISPKDKVAYHKLSESLSCSRAAQLMHLYVALLQR